MKLGYLFEEYVQDLKGIRSYNQNRILKFDIYDVGTFQLITRPCGGGVQV